MRGGPLRSGAACPFLHSSHPPTFPPSLLCSSQKHNGYVHSAGSPAARSAVAGYYNQAGLPMPVLTDKVRRQPGALRPTSPAPHPLTPPPPLPSTTARRRAQEVVIASGCSGALDLAISALLNAGDTLLVPTPGFPLYTTLATSRSIRLAPYRLDPARSWQVDLPDLARALAAATAGGARAALLLNNPSNPCGSVWSHAHTRAVLAAAEAARVPVIADEIYWHLAFPATGPALPAAAATLTVPVLTVGGTAKEYMVPGWRVGWVALHDRGGALAGVWAGLLALTQLVLGANTLVQGVLPALLPAPAPGSALAAWRADTLARLARHAEYAAERLAGCGSGSGGGQLEVIRPQGAMYVMFRVPAGVCGGGGAGAGAGAGAGGGERDDLRFAQRLQAEENVAVLPGSAFSAPGFCRVVITPPLDVLAQAFDRMAAFVARNY